MNHLDKARTVTAGLSDLAPELNDALTKDLARLAISKAREILSQWQQAPNAEALFGALTPNETMKALANQYYSDRTPAEQALALLNPRLICDPLDQADYANRILLAEIARQEGNYPPQSPAEARGIASRGTYVAAAQQRGDFGPAG